MCLSRAIPVLQKWLKLIKRDLCNDCTAVEQDCCTALTALQKVSVLGGWVFLIAKDSVFLLLRRVVGQNGYDIAVTEAVV